MKHFLTFLFFLSLTVSSSAQRKSWAGYRVYSAFLDSLNLDTTKSIVISDELEVEKHSSGLVEAIQRNDIGMIGFYTQMVGIDSLTLKLIVAYFSNQSKQSIIASGFKTDAKIRMTNNNTLKKLFKPDADQGWINFYTKYPNSSGIIRFSKIYFSTDFNMAAFYYSHKKASLNAWGDLVIMERTNDEWRVKYRFNLWVS